MEGQQGTKGVKWQQARPESVLGGMELIQFFFFFKLSFKLFSYTGMLTANRMDLFFALCVSAHPQLGSQHDLLENKLMEAPLRAA